MTINLMVSFAVIGLILFGFKWRKTGTVLIGLAVILYGADCFGHVPDYLMNRLQTSYSSQLQTQLEDNTAFIIFGMGTQAIDQRGQQTVEPLAFSYGPLLAAAA
jgi:Na+/phosphate symporter